MRLTIESLEANRFYWIREYVRILIPSLASIYPSNLYIPVDVQFVRFRNRVSFQRLYFKFSFPFLSQQRPSNSDQSQRYVIPSQPPLQTL